MPKIVYWRGKLQEAIQEMDSKGMLYAADKLAYFMERQKKVYGESDQEKSWAHRGNLNRSSNHPEAGMWPSIGVHPNSSSSTTVNPRGIISGSSSRRPAITTTARSWRIGVRAIKYMMFDWGKSLGEILGIFFCPIPIFSKRRITVYLSWCLVKPKPVQTNWTLSGGIGRNKISI